LTLAEAASAFFNASGFGYFFNSASAFAFSRASYAFYLSSSAAFALASNFANLFLCFLTSTSA
jgi:hypothetical protein